MELTLPDGSIFKGKIPETNKKIAEIVGLDASQFLQIAMIAQGDFLRLLLAPSKERKEIFGKIFNTRIYGRIQAKLREAAGNLERSFRRIGRTVSGNLPPFLLCRKALKRRNFRN